MRAVKANKLNNNIAITIKCSIILKLKIWIIFLPYIFSEISQMVRIKFSLSLSVIPHFPIQKYSITNSNIFSAAKNTIITPRDLKFKLFLSYMFWAIKQTFFFFFYYLDDSFLFKPRKTCGAERKYTETERLQPSNWPRRNCNQQAQNTATQTAWKHC